VNPIDDLGSQFDEAFQEVQQLHTLRFVWRSLLAMLQSQDEIQHNALVNSWLATCYSRRLAIGIRRQAEGHDDRATVSSVLRRLGEHGASITRELCGFPETLGDRDLWLRYAESATKPLDPATAAGELEKLTLARTAARKWVNKRVGHLDPSGGQISVKFGELNAGIDGLRDAVKFMFPLFNKGSLLNNMTPIVPPSWLQMFAVPWYVPEKFPPVDTSELG
jgi:hypothetical protein